MNMPRLTAALTATAVLFLPIGVRAQGTRADYERADALRERARDKVFKTAVHPHWSADGSRFWYRNDLAGGAREFIVVDAARCERRPAFDHARLAEALTRDTGKPCTPDRLPLDWITLADDSSVQFRAHDKGWRFDPKTSRLESALVVEPAPDSPEGPRRGPGESGSRPGYGRGDASPDGRWTTFVRDHNLHLRDKKTGATHPLSYDGSEINGYEPGVFWSPDSKRLVALQKARGDERKVYLIESSPPDQLQPKLHSYDYLKPGDQVPVSRPHLFDVAALNEIPVSDDLYPNPWSIDQIRWAPDSSRFTFLYNQRGHQVVRLVAVDAASGATRAIIEETSRTFVDYSQKSFNRLLDDTGEVLWASDRDGWNHLYLFDAQSGKLKKQVTKGEWLVRGVERVDEAKRQVWFRAGGIQAGQDPYYVQYARVNFDGSGLTVLTEGDGTHSASFSPGGRYLVDTYSRVDLPPVTVLRSAADGTLIRELERTDWSTLLATGWRAPERFVAKGRDGKTDIYGVIFRPTNVDPRAKYPVIEQIYAGPHGAFVPKGFAPWHDAQGLAELGFVVVQVDGMGTNWRSRAFHDVCWKNLGDAGFADRILWMKAAALEHSEMDLTRVGLYGGSAGGQSTLGGLLFHPEFYKVGAADCGCHDNRMDKIWWNEAWMGWPVGPEYAAASNVENAHRLRGKLLLTVGELDRNVDPASTMQVVSALIKAGKDFDLVVFPGAGHGAGHKGYGDRRRRDFFVRYLLRVEPPDRNADGVIGPMTSAAGGRPLAQTPGPP